jgi:trimethylamine--corrinoid protein Co-methyltransferase
MLQARTSRRSRRGRPVDREVESRAPAYLTRKIPVYELLGEEGLDQIEDQTEWILSEIGLEIRGDEIALQLFKDAGATVDGERVRFDRGHVRALCQTAPKTYTMHARNPERNIEFGGNNLILAPAYGSPFVTDLKGGRRYGTVADFQNFIKLTYMTPWLHHQSGTV